MRCPKCDSEILNSEGSVKIDCKSCGASYDNAPALEEAIRANTPKNKFNGFIVFIGAAAISILLFYFHFRTKPLVLIPHMLGNHGKYMYFLDYKIPYVMFALGIGWGLAALSGLLAMFGKLDLSDIKN